MISREKSLAIFESKSNQPGKGFGSEGVVAAEERVRREDLLANQEAKD